MEGSTKQRWLDVCSEAAICEDPERLQELMDEINLILRAEKLRLQIPQIRKMRTAP